MSTFDKFAKMNFGIIDKAEGDDGDGAFVLYDLGTIGVSLEMQDQVHLSVEVWKCSESVEIMISADHLGDIRDRLLNDDTANQIRKHFETIGLPLKSLEPRERGYHWHDELIFLGTFA